MTTLVIGFTTMNSLITIVTGWMIVIWVGENRTPRRRRLAVKPTSRSAGRLVSRFPI
ncbi:MAG: hypothetical protein ACRDUV_11120 [Pseudonocardiaceae bacterium]